MPTPESASKKIVEERIPRGALFDRTNDSPVIGLIPVKSSAKTAPVASDSPADKSSPSPAGEDVLRAHISDLLGLPADTTAGARNEASAEQFRKGDLRSPAEKLAPTPANSPACDTTTTGVSVMISAVLMSGLMPSPNTLQAAVATARAKKTGPVPDALVIATPVGRALAGSSAHRVRFSTFLAEVYCDADMHMRICRNTSPFSFIFMILLQTLSTGRMNAISNV